MVGSPEPGPRCARSRPPRPAGRRLEAGGQGGAVDALGAEQVGVQDLHDLLGREGLGGAHDEVAGVVDDDVQPSAVSEDRLEGAVGRVLREDVELDGAQLEPLGGCLLFDLADVAGVATLKVAHARVHDVAGGGEGARRQPADARGRARHENDCAHARPPFGRIVWPLIQPPSGLTRKATVWETSSGVPSRSRGAAFAVRSTTSSDFPRKKRSVAMGPGATALTLICFPRSSRARIAVRVSTAALAAAYAGEPGSLRATTLAR